MIPFQKEQHVGGWNFNVGKTLHMSGPILSTSIPETINKLRSRSVSGGSIAVNSQNLASIKGLFFPLTLWSSSSRRLWFIFTKIKRLFNLKLISQRSISQCFNGNDLDRIRTRHADFTFYGDNWYIRRTTTYLLTMYITQYIH